ncbi:MAG: tRNA (pseudouridine(54)-N(1))-methyltransferase TrmY [Candidatus Nanohaloarchaea archaeon]|nr:tRNA (pseudouridine(54)-N(1))-methyltransferase TrmY [Candidatus Nanohaloarchaea archaeon]
MPHFVVLAHDAPTDADFSLDTLTRGRLDLLARSVNAALLTSHGVREDTTASLVLQGEATIQFHGDRIGGLNPDERSIGGVLRKALQRLDGRGALPDGVRVTTQGHGPLLAGAEELVQLDGDGAPITTVEPSPAAMFVLSDHRPFTDEDEAELGRHDATRASLGPEPIHTDHAIAAVHNYLDTEGYATY